MIIVTGAAGFLGSHIVRQYLECGAEVLAVLHHKNFPFDTVASGTRFRQTTLDITKPVNNPDIFAGVDLVIHSAAKLSAVTPEEKQAQERVNIDGTRYIIEACLRYKVPRMVYISSTAAIGISPDPGKPADESFEYNLEQLNLSYNSTKHRAERMVLEANSPNLETVVVNPGFIFGRDAGSYRGSGVMEPALRNRLILCTHGGLSIVHIDDVVAGICLAANNGRAGERYILSGENISFEKIARSVCKQICKSAKLLVIPDIVRDFFGFLYRLRTRSAGPAIALHLDRRFAWQYYSSEKARRELGYNPRPFDAIVTDWLQEKGKNVKAIQ